MNGFPTHGNCEGTVAFEVTEESGTVVDLSGSKVVGSVKWPGAIHEGNGVIAVIIDANPAQAGGPGRHPDRPGPGSAVGDPRRHAE